MELGYSGMSIEEIKLFGGVIFQAVNALATAGVWIYVRYGNRNSEVDHKFEALRNETDRRLDSHEADLAMIKATLLHAPSHSDLTRIHTRIDEVSGALRRIEGEFSSTGKTIDLIHDYLMRK